MSLSMQEATVPVFLRTLRNLRHVLEIGEKHAADKGIAPEVLMQSRLIPDMLPLVRQVQIATDHAKNACARLAAVEAMPFPDEETTIAQLYARIDRCIEYVGTFTAAQFEGSESREVIVKSRLGELRFGAREYIANFALPNFFFHASMAYAILRDAGAPLGKGDWLGADIGR